MTDRGTESRNPRARGIGGLSTRAILELMNDEDAGVPAAVRAAIPGIERAAERIVAALSGGGRLRYVGAGTSGRLGVLDASEMPPTFGTDPDLVRGIIAGGDRALRTSVEGAEDDAGAGEAVAREHVRAEDVLVGISASGSARYVVAAVRAARAAGAATVGLTCVPGSPLAREAELPIVVETGPEL
ncbi:MAG TPA: N-acetylmuramic acid 6-phosphate etherase, partial [Candidatus Limnocylindria bacterium]|nr:N-acetylmuramic acid 6-phosphate etherase [Candidatus Limnocylindria bacterium]